MQVLARSRLSRAGLSRPIQRRGPVSVQASKGFGAEPKAAPKQAPKEDSDEEGPFSAPAAKAPAKAAPAPSVADKDAEALEALESRIRSRRRVEAKVKVNAPEVDVATGKTPATAEGEAEQFYLAFLSLYFVGVLIGGLLLAGAGFLPEEADLWITEQVYPAYSWIILGFLALSSLYGLFKTGKLPGQHAVGAAAV
ncbi:hypothetical protein TSOC_001566 [Tetrabaena socialis]|uniref:Uncharacterized protein n=1 Tax=Tetrabaena socialis TaxID=47790 RepID=A0A2J8AGH7_9CHLO|nr:hypothetical protein TSOC_001566 [Tetrabaena socialis]|eukprot:PNH11596.1 hypothetical protein TSOC_001566 [Tetrabaena socialis]